MSEQNKPSEQQSEANLLLGGRLAWIGGGAATVLVLVGQLLIGYVYNGAQARDLLQALVSPAGTLGGAIVQASATTLALMLTLLSISRNELDELERGFFSRVRQIALLSSIALASSILLLLFLSIPLEKSTTLPVWWYEGIYYTLLVILAGIGGIVVATVIMLYNAIGSTIRVVRTVPGQPDRRSKRKTPKVEGKQGDSDTG